MNEVGNKFRPANVCEVLDTTCLPKTIGAYVDSICSITDADPIMVTTSVLCMISAFVKKSCCIPEFDHKVRSGGYFQKLYPNLWCLNISRSGMFKSTALSKGFRIAYDWESSIGNQNQADSNSDTQSVILPTRVTAEGLLEHLSVGNAGAIVCSEFGAWLESLEKNYNQGLKALFTDLYDVPRLHSYKTRSSGYHRVKEPFITICGVSTFEWIKKNIRIEDVSSGFFARFLIFYPPQKDSTPPALPHIKQEIDREEGKKLTEIIKNLPVERAYKLKPEAEKKFYGFHEELYRSIQSEASEKAQDILQPYLKRWSPYVLKIAMLLQLVIDKEAKEICLEALQGAISIVEYAKKSTVWLFQNELGESKHQRKCRKILEYIAKKHGEVSRRKLIQSKVLDGGTNDYDYVLTTLEDSGEIEFIGDKNKKGFLKISLSSAED